MVKLIKFHHQHLHNSGYPAVLDGENPSYLGVQLISISDKSTLRYFSSSMISLSFEQENITKRKLKR